MTIKELLLIQNTIVANHEIGLKVSAGFVTLWTLAFFVFSSVAQVDNLRYAVRGEHNFHQTPVSLQT